MIEGRYIDRRKLQELLKDRFGHQYRLQTSIATNDDIILLQMRSNNYRLGDFKLLLTYLSILECLAFDFVLSLGLASLAQPASAVLIISSAVLSRHFLILSLAVLSNLSKFVFNFCYLSSTTYWFLYYKGQCLCSICRRKVFEPGGTLVPSGQSKPDFNCIKNSRGSRGLLNLQELISPHRESWYQFYQESTRNCLLKWMCSNSRYPAQITIGAGNAGPVDNCAAPLQYKVTRPIVSHPLNYRPSVAVRLFLARAIQLGTRFSISELKLDDNISVEEPCANIYSHSMIISSKKEARDQMSIFMKYSEYTSDAVTANELSNLSNHPHGQRPISKERIIESNLRLRKNAEILVNRGEAEAFICYRSHLIFDSKLNFMNCSNISSQAWKKPPNLH
ncbi:hypothetical protein CCUS01_02645 [Colletotrichum cuscutae]|uniref:Uncharacterized protein n=1 Tax=Colletotrichum cuscutae TaxID=1209917 RepID=A0AAI9YDL2_9PEZI|nr:hypothetical protein CCUS01_02645 [Colletotrichum cuscutae]